MDVRHTIYLVLLIFFILCSGFFSAVDMAYSAVKKSRLSKASKNDKNAKIALKLAQNYNQTIATILFGNDFVNILLSSLAAILSKDLLEPILGEVASSISSGVLLFILLLFGEILPKIFAKRLSFTLCIKSANLINTLYYAFFIIIYPISNFTAKIVNLITPNLKNQVATEDEIRIMAEDIAKFGLIDDEASKLLKNTIKFKNIKAREILTPRVHISGFDVNENLNTQIKEPNFAEHGRIIAYKKDLDHVLGYIPIKMLLKAIIAGKKIKIEEFIFPILRVGEDDEISAILAKMQLAKAHIALVVDQYGGTSGIVTMENILEELVGELYDEDEI